LGIAVERYRKEAVALSRSAPLVGWAWAPEQGAGLEPPSGWSRSCRPTSIRWSGQEAEEAALGEWRGVHRGVDEIRQMWEVFTEPWESVRLEIQEFMEANENVVVTRQSAHFIGRQDIELPGPVRSGWVWTFGMGKWSISPSTTTSTMPSKPPGCGSSGGAFLGPAPDSLSH
jgi:hypothetical protein